MEFMWNLSTTHNWPKVLLNSRTFLQQYTKLNRYDNRMISHESFNLRKLVICMFSTFIYLCSAGFMRTGNRKTVQCKVFLVGQKLCNCLKGSFFRFNRHGRRGNALSLWPSRFQIESNLICFILTFLLEQIKN